MQPAAVFGFCLGDHGHREVVLFVDPLVEFGFPSILLGLGCRSTLVLRGVAHKFAVVETLEKRGCGLGGIAVDGDRYRLYEAKHFVVGIDLDDLGVLWPVVHVVLRQRAEWPEPTAEGDDHISLVDQLHGGL